MWRIQLVLAVLALLVGLVLAVSAVSEERYWGFAVFSTAGIALAATIIFIKDCMSPKFWFSSVCAALLILFSVFDVITSSHLFKEAEAQRDFLRTLIELEIGPSNLTVQEKRFASQAFRVCAVQNELDQMGLVVNSYKALYFGSVLTLADGTNSLLTREQSFRCLDYYRELRKTQPQIFITLERLHPWLTQAGPQ